MKTILLLKVTLLFYVLFFCRSVGAQTVVSGSVSGTWTKVNSPYVLDGAVTVPSGQILTLEAGVVIESSRYDFHILVNGTLLANGTASDSVYFLGKANTNYTAASTHGGSIVFADGSSLSSLQYTSINLMGDLSSGGAAISISSGITPSIKNTLIKNSEVEDVLTWIGGSKNFSDVKAVVGINANAGNADATMARLGYNSYYKLVTYITVSANYKLTLEPGVRIELPRYDFGFAINGTLLAQGSASDSIKFIGKPNLNYLAASTHGGGIGFLNGSSGSVLEYVSIDLMGDQSLGGAAISIVAGVTPTIRHTLVKNSEVEDIVTWVGGCKNFSDVKAVVGIDSGTGSVDATMANLGYDSHYKLLSGITITSGYKLIIESGVQIDCPRYDLGLTINGTLIAQGSLTDSIKIVGKANTAYTPSSTHGGSIFFNQGSSSSILDYVSIDRMGDISTGGATISIASGVTPVIKNVLIKNSEAEDIVSWVGGAKNFTSLKAIVGINAGTGGVNAVMSKLGFGSYYKLMNGVTVNNNETLTINPGVELRSLTYNDLLTINGTLNAKGTASDSIRFLGFSNTGFTPASTHGGQLSFGTGSTGSELEYVVMDRWGDKDYHGSAIIMYSSGVSLKHSAIRNSELLAVNIASGNVLPTIAGVKFEKNGKDIEASLASVGNVTECANVAVYLRAETTQGSFTVPKPGDGSYYVLSGGELTIPVNTTATVMPGVEIRSQIYTDRILVNGNLIAKGTVTDSIRFTGVANPAYTQASSHGGQLYFAATSTSSDLEYVAMDRWGDKDYHGAAIAIYSSGVRISRSVIRNSELQAVSIASGTVTPTIFAVKFEKNGKDIETSLSSVGGISECPNVAVFLRAEQTQGSFSVPKPGNGSYYVLPGGDLNIAANSIATVMPGVQIRSQIYTDRILVNGTLIAKGTASDSIRFIGVANPGYTPSSTHGGQLYFSNSSIGSQLEYVLMDRWGDKDYHGTALSIGTSGLSLTKSTIRNSEGIGFQIVTDGVSPTISHNSFFNNPRDISTGPGSVSAISNNTACKIFITGGTTNSNATWPYPGAGSYYILDGTVNIPQTFTLTIEAGTLLNSGSNSPVLNIYGTLRAIGSETAPVQFSKLESNGANAELYFHSASTGSVLNNVTLDHWGNSYAIYVATADISITNIAVSNSANYGFYYTGNGSNTISRSSFFNNKTGVFVANGRPGFVNCNIYGNSEYGINNISVATADTVDARSSYWGHSTGPFHGTINPSGEGNKVSDKVKFVPWKSLPSQGQITDIGVSAILSPLTDCNYSSATSVKVAISNYGNLSLSSFQVSYRINGGATVSELVNANLLPGRTIDYTFSVKADLSALGNYAIESATLLAADTLIVNDRTSNVIEHLPGIASASSLFPVNNSAALDIPVLFTWGAVAGATGYDLYVWKTTDPVPAQPIVASMTQINYSMSSLSYGTAYHWKIVARRASCRAESATMSFSTRQLPDLIVDAVSAPASATSESDIVISWTVKNQGGGDTGNTPWRDLVYLSDQPVMNTGAENFYITDTGNFSALAAGQSYQSGNYTFRIPQGLQGSYYVIVQTNSSFQLKETAEGNNLHFSIPINISLAPPPDLQVKALTVSPLTAFSEDEVTVTYTVANKGTGPTTASEWNDVIYISTNETGNPASDRQLHQHHHTGALPVNGEYSTTTRVKLPERISGAYYVHVVTDRGNQVFEYNLEGNNRNTSLPVTIFQRPTPNLIVSAIGISAAKASNSQSVTVQWTTANEGALTARPVWYERVYLSSDQVFSQSSDRVLAVFPRSDSLQSLGSISTQQVVNIPANTAEGEYYFFVLTDAEDNIYENPAEDDNASVASSKIQIVNPDLRGLSLTAPATASSEQTIDIQWKVRNDSQAGIYNTTWMDRVYLSVDDTFDSGVDIPLNAASFNQILPAGADYSKQISATLPVGISGNYYLLLINDADNAVFEKLETNNFRSVAISITLAPSPDLVGTQVVSAAIDTVGTLMNFQYTIKNTGSGSIVNKKWTDNIYLSPGSTVNESSLIFLGHVYQTRSVSTGQSFTQNAEFYLPVNIPAGSYYIVVKTDYDNSIFENTAENNNTYVSTGSTTIRTLPVIDLSVTGGEILSTTMTAGQPIDIRWTVKNNTAFSTIVPSWTDAVYLSNNPVLDPSDILLSGVLINRAVAGGGSYTRSLTVVIPQQVSGTLYVLVSTDTYNQNNDDNRNNNTLALAGSGGGQAVTIITPPPADLIPISLSAPAQGFVSQPIMVTFKVKNNGTGSTPSSTWVDQLFLSTDIQEGGAFPVASFPHAGTLAPGEEYDVSGQVFLPSSMTGNYILLLKTDFYNTVFERGNEANNLAFTNLLVVPQLPSDLVVRDVSVPSSVQLAGSQISVSWTLANIGANAVNGFLREAVYISRDTIADASDVLLGTLDGSVFLPPLASNGRTLEKPLNNVGIGEYYVLVKTDLLNNIQELNENNNNARSVGKLTVNVRELAMNAHTPDQVMNNQPVYYRIEIPAVLINETLFVTLKGDPAKNGVNRLYIRKDSVPTTNRYDYASAVPFEKDQEITIPSLSAGTYYLMSLGVVPLEINSPIDLFARIIPFSVVKVDAPEGGNTGLATIKITGAKFDGTTTFQLRKSATDVLTPHRVQVVNQTLAFVTFDLLNKTKGVYDVEAIKSGGAAATLPQSFTIRQGPGNTIAGSGNGGPGYGTGFVCSISNIGFEDEMETYVLAPATTRINLLTTLTVYFKNEGTVDIPVPTKFLVSLSDQVPLGFTASQLLENKKDLILECKEEGGPPGILRPGAGGFFKIYTKSTLRTVRTIDLVITD